MTQTARKIEAVNTITNNSVKCSVIIIWGYKKLCNFILEYIEIKVNAKTIKNVFWIEKRKRQQTNTQKNR